MAPTRTLGNSDLSVSPIGLGGNVFGWTADEPTSHRILDAYVDAGGNFIDTADGYSHWAEGHVGGESEAVIGSWLADRGRRDDVIIATKVATKPGREGLAAGNIRTALDESLERLHTDHVDVYYAHYDDPNTPLEETVAAFEEARVAGKTRHVALSNYTPDRVEEWCAIAAANDFAAPVALQPHYNLVHRHDVEGPGNRGEVAAAHQLGMVPYFALASGFLTGKYRPAAATGAEVASPRGGWVEDYLRPECFAVVDVLREVAAAHDVAPAAVALAWLRDRPGVVAPLASARTLEQLGPIVDALTLTLTADETAALTRASDQV
ncbi:MULTISPECIES: aldo/keto reductase [unclassified Actinomyces]|uniref:aldo/keto reductase n=1 Tax=unclassified Actinomyces TaxID=2609248 RepID=UPI000D5997A3|nr:MULTISPECIES: aldo/keto reductase [unclassified Actinomyces]RAX20093.1 aldo/keto reductase [Actinomyces sp. Z5]RAX23045.1 aldo/keto reductase [Actinomyces sp. Z3]